MTRTRTRFAAPTTLLVVNLLLLGLLAAITLGPRASAQIERRRSEYLITSGTVAGTTSAAIYIIDQTNQELIAVMWNNQNNVLDGIGYRDLVGDAATLLRGSRN